jgi:hypothetical protein
VGWRSVPLLAPSSCTREPRPRRNIRSCGTKIIVPSKFFGGWLMIFQLTFSFEASNPCRIAASSTSMFISFRVLNLMQYPLTLALPSVFP